MKVLNTLVDWLDNGYVEGVLQGMGTWIPLYVSGTAELTGCCGCRHEVAWYARRCPRCAIRQPGRADIRWLRRAWWRGLAKCLMAFSFLGATMWLNYHPAQLQRLLGGL